MPRNQHYQDRVNRVLNYIAEHLDSDLSLATLSRISCFSAFHFHRVFQGITGETLNHHVRRVRLERAASLLKASPRKRITAVALQTGFPGTAEFSRAFKNHFGHTASSWDRRSPLEKSKICQAPGSLTFHTEEELQHWQTVNKVSVRLQRYSSFRYVYRRVYAPYGSTGLLDAYHALSRWLAERDRDNKKSVFLGMSLDDPSLTPAKNCCYDLGIAFPQQPGGVLDEILRWKNRKTNADRWIPTLAECEAKEFSVRDFPAQSVVSLHCAGDLSQVGLAWQYLYRIWLPSSIWEPADLPAMEFFRRLPEEIGWNTFDLQLCIPVVRL